MASSPPGNSGSSSITVASKVFSAGLVSKISGPVLVPVGVPKSVGFPSGPSIFLSPKLLLLRSSCEGSFSSSFALLASTMVGSTNSSVFVSTAVCRVSTRTGGHHRYYRVYGLDDDFTRLG